MNNIAKQGVCPAISLLLLIGLFVYQQGLEAKADSKSDYHDRIGLALRDLPKSYDGWIGQSVEVPNAASELLHANEILSRSYRNLETGESVELVVVHCSDARDLIGHYPPVCYPASGWVAEGAKEIQLSRDALIAPASQQRSETGEETFETEVVNLGWPCALYQFERMSQGYTVQMVVMNYMVLPDGRIGRNMEIVNRAASDLQIRDRGAMQVQVIFRDEMMSGQRRIEIAEAFLGHLRPVFDAVWDEEETKKP